MRQLCLSFLAILLLNCEDKKTKPSESESNQSKTEVQKDTATKESENNLKTQDSIDDFLLNDDNVMEFFLQYEKEHKENKVRIVTEYGNIDIELFEETKFHRANFIYLTKKNYFDGTQFYRVIENYIIQGGSTDDADIMAKREDIGKYLLPTDTERGFHHDRGVISMPSSDIDNPYKLASPYEFFITLRDVYQLDGDYTIFGRVIDGLEVADKIAEVDTDDADWPLLNIYIKEVKILE